MGWLHRGQIGACIFDMREGYTTRINQRTKGFYQALGKLAAVCTWRGGFLLRAGAPVTKRGRSRRQSAPGGSRTQPFFAAGRDCTTASAPNDMRPPLVKIFFFENDAEK